ncbi:MAG TPA: DUF1993 domain-containing protein [Burkholderiaceae bacterium]|jgi:uncharacterized protein|nr:DUF1993 domain-containing protein [Burkholderiaceae bacterium]
MAISMYEASVPVFQTMLGNVSTWLDRAAAHAKARKFDAAALLQARLFPDMFPLTRQVQIAADTAKYGVARLAGVSAPRDDDSEASIDELKARIARTLDFIGSVARDRFDGSENRPIEVPLRPQPVRFDDGRTFLLQFTLPNFYFHVTTAYALLRHNGVELGKQDFLPGAAKR